MAHALSRSMGSSVSCLKDGVAPGQNKDTEMNWFRRDSSEKVNYKARLEHKQMMVSGLPKVCMRRYVIVRIIDVKL